MNTATPGYQPSGLRVSDSDRDRAIAELSEHFQAGRLTTDEFEERTGRALKARTAGDLAELFTDLPRKPSAAAPGPPPASGPGLALPPASSPARSGSIPVIPLVIVAIIVLGGFISGHSIVGVLVPVLIAVLVIRRIIEGDRHDRRDRPDRRRSSDDRR
jgi:uncharacterized protein DUF1707